MQTGIRKIPIVSEVSVKVFEKGEPTFPLKDSKTQMLGERYQQYYLCLILTDGFWEIYFRINILCFVALSYQFSCFWKPFK